MQTSPETLQTLADILNANSRFKIIKAQEPDRRTPSRYKTTLILTVKNSEERELFNNFFGPKIPVGKSQLWFGRESWRVILATLLPFCKGEKKKFWSLLLEYDDFLSGSKKERTEANREIWFTRIWAAKERAF